MEFNYEYDFEEDNRYAGPTIELLDKTGWRQLTIGEFHKLTQRASNQYYQPRLEQRDTPEGIISRLSADTPVRYTHPVIKNNSDEETISREIIFKGLLHWNNGPARIFFTRKNRKIIQENWFVHGSRHRNLGPAVISYDSEGTPVLKVWWQRGKRHRIDGPAYISYETVKTEKKWFVEDKEIPNFPDPSKINVTQIFDYITKYPSTIKSVIQLAKANNWLSLDHISVLETADLLRR